MKKIVLAIGVLLVSAATVSAQKYMTRTAKISFDATAKGSPENIVAVNNEVASIMDGATGDLVFQAQIKSFKFERALMQEHFNENYMESDKYPKADFKGKISNFSDVHLDKDGTYNVKVAGKLTIHGVTNDVDVPGVATVKNGVVIMKANFPVVLADYKISIPNMVADKVGKQAGLTIESSLNKK